MTTTSFALRIGSLCVLCASASRAAEPTYWQDVRPLFRKHCTVCHNARNLAEVDVSAGLALDSFDGALKAKKRAVTPGKAKDSELIRRLHAKDAAKRMPPDAEPLPAAEAALIARWIDAGAPEGRRVEEVAAIAPAASPANAARKLDVVLATKYSPPKALAAKPFPQNSPLELVLPVGPLPPAAAVAFSPDGKLLAAGCYGRVTVWDLAAAKPAKVLTNVLGSVNDVRFNPDGSLLAVAGGQPSARGDLRLYRTADWSLAATLGGHADVVNSVAWSPDGRRLASASFDKSVRVWDVAKRQPALTLTGHTDFVYAVAWSPKGDWLATASKDRTVKLVDATTGASRLTLSGMEQEVHAVAISPDGSQVVSAGFEPQLHWWNCATGERTRRVAGHDVAVHELVFARDGKLVASAGADKTVRLWNAASGQSARSIAVGTMVYAVAVAADGKAVAAGSFDGLVRLYDSATGRLLATLAAAGDDWCAVTGDGYAAASDGWAAAGRFRVAGQVLPAEALWPALRQPEMAAKALRGDKVPEPAVKR